MVLGAARCYQCLLWMHAWQQLASWSAAFWLQVTRAILGGLLVGVGAAAGNGCTSGHGICGNARLSLRSMAFT